MTRKSYVYEVMTDSGAVIRASVLSGIVPEDVMIMAMQAAIRSRLTGEQIDPPITKDIKASLVRSMI